MIRKNEIQLETMAHELAEVFLSSAFSSVVVDTEQGIVKNVAVITQGPAKGHGWFIDSKMLDQVLTSIKEQPEGVRVRWSHPSKGGGSNAVPIGRLKNPRRDGMQIRADVHIGDYAKITPLGDMRSFVLELAKEDPGQMGISIRFDPAQFESLSQDGAFKTFGRVAKITGADIVDDPAANTNGLLSQNSRKTSLQTGAITMTELQKMLNGLIDAAVKPDRTRDTVLAAMAEAGGTDLTTVEAVLSGNVGCPEKTMLEGFATALGAAAAGIISAAERDGCKFSGENGQTGQAAGGGNSPASPEPDTQTNAGNGQVNAAGAPIAGQLNASQIQALADKAATNAVALDRQRNTELRALAKAHNMPDGWADQQIDLGTPVESARNIVLTHLAENPPSRANGTGVATGGENLSVVDLSEAISDAFITRGHHTNLIEMDRHPVTNELTAKTDVNGAVVLRKPHERARSFMGRSIMGVVEKYLAAVGVDTDQLTPTEMAQLVFNRRQLAQARVNGSVGLAQGTADFDNILADTINKTLRAAYNEFQPNWSTWAREAFAPDFKQVSRNQLSGMPTPPTVRAGAEYTLATVADSKEVYTLAKYGHIFSIFWETLINDDLQAFTRVPVMNAAAAARIEDDLAYAIITANAALSDGVSLFHASHSNIGTGAVLSVASLGDARQLMRRQTGLKSEPLDIRPAVLLVPVTLETTAEQLIASTVDPSKSNATPNPFSGNLRVVSNPRLDTDSVARWYVMGSTAQADTVEVGFLEGHRQPQLEEKDGFEVDGRNYKIRHVVAAKAIDHRAMVKNDGP